MSLRDRIAGNRIIVGIGALGLIVVAGVLFVARGGAQSKHLDAIYFYNLESGELFTQPIGTLPPVDGGVRAFVYACGECSEQNRFISHLITMPAEAKAALDAGNVDDPGTFVGMNQQIAAYNDANELEWLPRHSPQGEAIADAPATRCDGKPAKQCRP